MDELRHLLNDQSGVVSRRQVLSTGFRPHDLARFVRRRELVAVHTGVYVEHTGPLTWLQRAWAGVLATEPSVLCGESALRASDGPGRTSTDDEVIHVAVDRARRVDDPTGVRVHRMTGWRERAIWTLAPPRLSYEDAALDVALESGDRMQVLAVLAGVCQRRRTTAARLKGRLAARKRVPMRAWLDGILDDVAAGTCSVLEHGYLTLVERAHGLPRPRRQVPGAGTLGLVYRDVEYPDFVVEIDGRLFHDNVQQRDLDFDRDLDVAADGRLTVRLTYGQVFRRPCRTAGRLGKILERNGWTGQVTRCGPHCAIVS